MCASVRVRERLCVCLCVCACALVSSGMCLCLSFRCIDNWFVWVYTHLHTHTEVATYIVSCSCLQACGARPSHAYGQSLLCSVGRAARVQVARRIRCTVRGRPRRRHQLPHGHVPHCVRRLMRTCSGRRRQAVRRNCGGHIYSDVVPSHHPDWLRVVFGGRQLLLQRL
jgi:hypothetical protein